MKLDIETFQKWKNWIDKIKDDLMQLIDYKQIHDYFIIIINANLEHINENNGKKFCDFVRKCYAVQAAVGIRRHVKSDKGSISLMRLLEQIKKCSSQFTYDFYNTQCFPMNGTEWQKSTFRNFTDDENVLSEQKIEADIESLKKIAETVQGLVDRRVAHLDQRGYREDVTYQDIDNSLDIFNEIACKYLALLTGHGYATLKPELQYNWKSIFNVPLDIRKFES